MSKTVIRSARQARVAAGTDAGTAALFELPAELREFQARVRHIAETEIAPHAAETDRSERYPRQCVEVLKREGFMGMTIPVELGGGGASVLQAVVLIEEMAKACSTIGRICVEANMGAVGAIMAYGSDAQKRLAASLVLAGDKPAICITEPEAGSAATEMTTRADHRGDRYVLSGKKHNLALERKVRDARMFPIAGGTAQILRTQVAGAILGIKTPQTRDGYLRSVKDD
jgi:alkylation response protein AidB-like acyl-CoA dehydrogenase